MLSVGRDGARFGRSIADGGHSPKARPGPAVRRPHGGPARAAHAGAGAAALSVRRPVRLSGAGRAWQVAPGDLVLVPLNRREEVGVVWDGPPDAAVGDNRLRPISARVDAPPMRADLRRLVDWIAAYTLAPPGEVLAMALRVNALRAEPPATGWRLADNAARGPPDRGAQARAGGAGRRAAARRRRAGTHGRGFAPACCAPWPMRGCCCRRRCRVRPPFARPDPEHPGPTLSPDQETAAAALRAAVAGGRVLRDAARRRHRVGQDRGLSGSGGRNACAPAGRRWCCCRKSRCPPSGWTGSRTGSAWHRRSGIPICPRGCGAPPGGRWTAGTATVVVGARSALFLPFPDLGLVIIDEEHETAFKQEDGVVYHARDMAVVRARLCARAGGAGLGHAQPGDAGKRRVRPLPPPAFARPARRRPACRTSN